MLTLLMFASLLTLSSMDSFREASDLLDFATKKAGVSDPARLSFHLDGVTHQIEQSQRPEPPYLQTELHEQVFIDRSADVIVHDVTSTWPYFTSRVTARVEGKQLLTIHHARQTHELRAEGGDAVRARISRRHPHLLLAAARERRATLRAAGTSAFTFVDHDGRVVRVALDPESKKVAAAEWLSYDPLLGDLALEVRFGWNGGELTSWQQFENGRLVTDARYRDLRMGARATAPSSDIPETYTTPPAMPGRAEVELVPLGENVELIRNAGGRDYHSLLVRFADHLVIVEAPFSAEGARRSIQAVRARYPALPIRDLVVTHHHYDHIGGIRVYAEAGARIITTTGNVSYLRTLLAAPHTIQRAAPIASPLVIAVPTRHRIAGATNELVLFDAGPTDHVAEILIAWLPRQKVLFQGDLFRHDPGTMEPARPAAVRLEEMIRERALDAKIIAGVHGEPATLAELRAAIARRADEPASMHR